MATVEELHQMYDGEIVPRSFNAGFVTLSYVISLIGAFSTLELINRRTAPKGKFNHLLLIGSAVTMGGIAIWSMHFIGSRAIVLADGQSALQIAYSSGFTTLSFFIPIVVLIVAFVALGTQDTVSWWRVIGGGILTGAAVCGMHYLGNASIYNYTCIYKPINVVGAAIIAVAASIVALSMFFVFRAAWAAAWWKRLASAVVLAGAVSGMHWCAATGTNYRYREAHTGETQLSQNATVIIVICLSIGACCLMAGLAVYSARMRRRYASKAQQVVLAAAVFDNHGRILVNTDGLLPSEMMTDTFLEKNHGESFNTGHRLFHWMFQTSRNWSGISPLIEGMSNHLAQLPRHGRDRDARMNIKLISEHGEIIDKYDVIFRELFCVAAVALAEKLKEHISNVGVLWDEILPTGAGAKETRISDKSSEADSISGKKSPKSEVFDMEKGLEQASRKQQMYGRGSLMFLVRKVDSERDVEKLGAAGYRFAPLHQVAPIIGSSMQIKTRDVEARLRDLAKYSESKDSLEPGVHMGFFGIRARVGAIGFDVLVRKEARNLLPTMQLPIDKLETWHHNFLQRMDNMMVSAIEKQVPMWKDVNAREREFAMQLLASMQDLRTWLGDPILNDATLTAKVMNLPCRNDAGAGSPAVLIALKLVIPIHVNVASINCEFIPLNFFKVQQLACSSSPYHMTFVRSVHRELGPIINSVPVAKPKPAAATQARRSSFMGQRVPDKLKKLAKFQRRAVDSDGNPIPTVFGRSGRPVSNQSSSTLKLWDRRSSDPHSPSTFSYDNGPQYGGEHQQGTMAAALGGIMVSQEITVDVHDMGEPNQQVQRETVRQPKKLHRRPSQGVVGQQTPNLSSQDVSVIEMGPLRAGMGTQVANIEVEKLSEVATYVDELFAICIDTR